MDQGDAWNDSLSLLMGWMIKDLDDNEILVAATVAEDDAKSRERNTEESNETELKSIYLHVAPTVRGGKQ